MSLVPVKEIDPTQGVYAQFRARKLAREARMKAAARRVMSQPVKALSAPEPAPKQIVPKINPFEFMECFAPINAAANVTFTIPAWGNPNRGKSIAMILQEVAQKYGVGVNDIKGHRRSKRLVQAKMEAYWRARNETVFSMPTIGKLMGGKDHTTILYGIRTYERYRRVKAGLEEARRCDATLDWEKVIAP